MRPDVCPGGVPLIPREVIADLPARGCAPNPFKGGLLHDSSLMSDMAVSMPGRIGRGRDPFGNFIITKHHSSFKAALVGRFWLDVSFRTDEYPSSDGMGRRLSGHYHSLRTCRYDIFTAVRMCGHENEAYLKEMDRLNAAVAVFGSAPFQFSSESGMEAFTSLKEWMSELFSSMKKASAESKVRALELLMESRGALNRVLRSKSRDPEAEGLLFAKLAEFREAVPAWRAEEIRKFSAYNRLREASFRQLRDGILKEELRSLSSKLAGPGKWGVRKFMMDDLAVIRELGAFAPGVLKSDPEGCIAKLAEAGKKIRFAPPRAELLKAYASLKTRGRGGKRKRAWLSAQTGSVEASLRENIPKDERDKLSRYLEFLKKAGAGERIKPASDYISKAVHMLQVNKPWYWAEQLRETGDPYLMESEKGRDGRSRNVVELIEAANGMLFGEYASVQPATIARASELYGRASELL